MPGLGEMDEVDFYGTFTPEEAAALGVIEATSDIEGQPDSTSAGKPAMNTETFEKHA